MAHAEASARTVEAAVAAAAAELGLRADQVEVEVLQDPVPSTFGYIGSPARVRVTPRTAPDPPAPSSPSGVRRHRSSAPPSGRSGRQAESVPSEQTPGPGATGSGTAGLGTAGPGAADPSDAVGSEAHSYGAGQSVTVPAPVGPGGTDQGVAGSIGTDQRDAGVSGATPASARDPVPAQDAPASERRAGALEPQALTGSPGGRQSDRREDVMTGTQSETAVARPGESAGDQQGAVAGRPGVVAAGPPGEVAAGRPEESAAGRPGEGAGDQPRAAQDGRGALVGEGPLAAAGTPQPLTTAHTPPTIAGEGALPGTVGGEGALPETLAGEDAPPASAKGASALPSTEGEGVPVPPPAGAETGGSSESPSTLANTEPAPARPGPASSATAPPGIVGETGAPGAPAASPPAGVEASGLSPSNQPLSAPPAPAPGPTDRTRRDEPIDPEAVEFDTERAGDFLEGLLDALDVDGDITTWVDQAGGHIDLEGSDLEAFIGPNGETLDALQELTRLAVLRQSKRRVRLLLDINGFRVQQRERLAASVRATVEQVLRTREEHELQPMSPAERKIVHDVVAPVEGVQTESVGEEPHRRVIIRPA